MICFDRSRDAIGRYLPSHNVSRPFGDSISSGFGFEIRLQGYLLLDGHFRRSTTSTRRRLIWPRIAGHPLKQFYHSVSQVDLDKNETVKLNIDITVAMQCGYLGADVLDISNKHNAWISGN